MSKPKSSSKFIFLGYGKQYGSTCVVFRFEVDPITMKRKGVIRTDEAGKRYIYWAQKYIYLPEGV